jgi:alginate O-acetyltransferase complex protein AlgJ
MSSPAPASSDLGDLDLEHIKAIYRELLGRAPATAEIDAWMRTRSLRAFLEGVLASEEYLQRLAASNAGKRPDGQFLNCWITGHWERFARPSGDVSSDGQAIVGRYGHLFIYGGTNDNITAQCGEMQMPASWIDEWRGLVTERRAAALSAGRQLVCLVVPEKIAVYADYFPQALTSHGLRPVSRLLNEGKLPLVYPLEVMRDARRDGDTYLVTDSHLTLLGNRRLAAATMQELGVEFAVEVDGTPREYVHAGDIGSHFNPPIVEIRRVAKPSQATIVFDNWAEVSRVGAHVGTMRVFRNDHAQDKRTVVVFGDSYGFGDDSYHGLSWHLAQAFREVHFVWVPFGWDPDYLDSVGADLVVCQTAERFVVRVPRARIDVRMLIEGTINQEVALTADDIFRDRYT